MAMNRQPRAEMMEETTREHPEELKWLRRRGGDTVRHPRLIKGLLRTLLQSVALEPQ